MKQTNVTTHPYFSYKPSLLSRSYIIESWRLYAFTQIIAEKFSLHAIKRILSEIEVLNKERDII